jgi:hypothetical protein
MTGFGQARGKSTGKEEQIDISKGKVQRVNQIKKPSCGERRKKGKVGQTKQNRTVTVSR